MMKKLLQSLSVMLTLTLLLAGCGNSNSGSGSNTDTAVTPVQTTLDGTLSLPSDELYDGYFEEDLAEFNVTCLSGTPDCYTVDGNILTFTAVQEDTVYAISGKLKGNIVIDTGDGYKFDLEMHGFSLVSESANPILVTSGDRVTLTAKKDFENFIYDMREAVSDTDETAFSGAIYSTVDLELAGKGTLTMVSANNNGIHSKDDLKVKNLTLSVSCIDNALKGNDSVTIENANTQLVARQGDGIKTTNTDVSSKGNQRGTVTITGGVHTIGAACDGIDAAYDVVIDDETTQLTIYTDKYSDSSEEVTATSNGTYYLRATSTAYRYAIKYYNSDSDFVWVKVSDDYETVSSGNQPGGFGPGGNRPGQNSATYYYYNFAKKSDYSKFAVYMYQSTQEPGQDQNYYACSSYKTLNDSYDTVVVTLQSGNLSVGWTNYTTQSAPGGFGGGFGGGMGGGMNDGNRDKGNYSTKGIKSGNEIFVRAGTVRIKSYDDAVHANKEGTLENGASPLGNVTVSGGTLTLYSNDDGIHADGILTVSGGSVTVENSYEGLEGTQIVISGGNLSVIASDDGINSTATSGTGITISGGKIYVYCTGDGIDANTRTAYSGIIFSGGETIVISNSTGNSALDTENGYTYTGGAVLAIMPQRGMTSEAINCSNFSSIGTRQSVSLNSGATITVKIQDTTLSVQMPCSMAAYVIALGDKSASVSSK